MFEEDGGSPSTFFFSLALYHWSTLTLSFSCTYRGFHVSDTHWCGAREREQEWKMHFCIEWLDGTRANEKRKITSAKVLVKVDNCTRTKPQRKNNNNGRDQHRFLVYLDGESTWFNRCSYIRWSASRKKKIPPENVLITNDFTEQLCLLKQRLHEQIQSIDHQQTELIQQLTVVFNEHLNKILQKSIDDIESSQLLHQKELCTHVKNIVDCIQHQSCEMSQLCRYLIDEQSSNVGNYLVQFHTDLHRWLNELKRSSVSKTTYLRRVEYGWLIIHVENCRRERGRKSESKDDRQIFSSWLHSKKIGFLLNLYPGEESLRFHTDLPNLKNFSKEFTECIFGST